MKKLFTLLFVLLISISAYCADILVRDINKTVVAKLRLSSGTTYNIYNTKGVKIGSYKSPVKLTATYMKGRKFKLVKVGTAYTIKE